MSVEDTLAEYKHLLLFEAGLHPDKGEVTLVRSKEFMRGEEGKETWIRINAVVKQLGGEWVSAGKESHWLVPVKAEKPSESFGSVYCPHCNRKIQFTVGAPK